MEKDIDRITKNPDTDIVIRIDDFGGKRGLTIREFVKSERYTGFTKAGTRIPADKFAIFKNAINSISVDDMMAEAEPSSSSASAEQKKSFANKGNESKDNKDTEDFSMDESVM